MRYHLFSANDPIGKAVEDLLKKEIRKLDIRAEFIESSDRKVSEKAEAVISVTSSARKIYSDLPCFNIYLCAKRNRFVLVAPSSRKETRYLDLPFSNLLEAKYLGCPHFDVFKSKRIIKQDHKNSDLVNIPIIEGYKERRSANTVFRLKKALQSNLPEVSFPIIDLEKDLNSFGNLLNVSNAAIVTCWIGELAALYFNVPYVFFNGKHFFRRRIHSLQHTLLNHDVTIKEGSKPTLISSELKRILADHQYTAGMLQTFQEMKEIIGNQPSIRSIARDILEKLEF